MCSEARKHSLLFCERLEHAFFVHDDANCLPIDVATEVFLNRQCCPLSLHHNRKDAGYASSHPTLDHNDFADQSMVGLLGFVATEGLLDFYSCTFLRIVQNSAMMDHMQLLAVEFEHL